MEWGIPGRGQQQDLPSQQARAECCSAPPIIKARVREITGSCAEGAYLVGILKGSDMCARIGHSDGGDGLDSRCASNCNPIGDNL